MTTITNSENDYYSVLNVERSATHGDILRAYQETKLIFQPESLAVYSLYSEEELSTIITQLDEAYQVLSNPEKRFAYDQQICPASIPKDNKPAEKAPTPLKAEVNNIDNSYKAHIASTSTHISGALLKEVRESQGFSIDDISSKTKISQQYLVAIEAEDISNFPEPVYLKSFLKQYASAIDLDPELVLKTYDALNIHIRQFLAK